jgi:Zn-dependent protease with chaperone function
MACEPAAQRRARPQYDCAVSHEVAAEVVFTGLVVLLVLALVLHLAISAYRERRAKRLSADAAGRPPAE